jgi:uncharacterized membrane protein
MSSSIWSWVGTVFRGGSAISDNSQFPGKAAVSSRLDLPKESSRGLVTLPKFDEDAPGRVSEAIARFLGTPKFLIWLTVFCAIWLAWNTLAPDSLQFDHAYNGFTALTLMLSLQASYAAPLILLAQNRQDNRDRVTALQDRQRAERNLADTEYLAREIAAIRISINEAATRDFIRSEIRDMLDDVVRIREQDDEILATRELDAFTLMVKEAVKEALADRELASNREN